MTRKNYLASCELHGQATVVGVGTDDRGGYVVLDQTWFHPQGGGQRADAGVIDSRPVLHVAHAVDGTVLHYLDQVAAGLAAGDEVVCSVDPTIRDANAGLHSAGHLIACSVERLFPTLRATQGHHWPGEARVEFRSDAGVDVDAVRERLDVALREAIAADLPVRVEGDRLRDRLIRIGNLGAVPCGGTHVDSLRRLGLVVIKSIKLRKDLLRVSYEVQSVAAAIARSVVS